MIDLIIVAAFYYYTVENKKNQMIQYKYHIKTFFIKHTLYQQAYLME